MRRLLIAMLMLMPLTVGGQTTTMLQTYTWTAPTTGSPVVRYEIQKSNDAGSTWVDIGTVTSTTTTIVLPVLIPVIIRVRGQDAANRFGPYSVASDAYIPDPGPPGACGKPGRS